MGAENTNINDEEQNVDLCKWTEIDNTRSQILNSLERKRRKRNGQSISHNRKKTFKQVRNCSRALEIWNRYSSQKILIKYYYGNG